MIASSSRPRKMTMFSHATRPRRLSWVMMMMAMTTLLCLSNTEAFQPTAPSKVPDTMRRLSNGRNSFPLTLIYRQTSQLGVSLDQQRQNEETTAAASSASTSRKPGTAVLDVPWPDLGFEYRPTRSHLQMTFTEGQGWGEMELVSEPYINLHIGATALHYGQACFEGLKAFCHADGHVYLFRPEENAARMQSSCRRTLMPEVPTNLFVEACRRVVQDNLDYVPPYGSNGALYIRPLLFGSGPRIGLQPADQYTFLVLVIPVGDYYRGGLSKPVRGRLIQDYDRAAPRGVGHVKVAGNYAADLLPNQQGKKAGYPIGLYLDAATQSTIEEFSTSNFVGLIHGPEPDGGGGVYVTPRSGSVLPSITNKSLMQIAVDEGFDVQERAVPMQELENFDEVLAVGTAVVVTPVGSITQLDPDTGAPVQTYTFGPSETEIGPVTQRLYQRVRAIQNGEEPDKYGWNVKVT